MRRTRHHLAIPALVLVAICTAPADAVELFAGGFSFSDELGGFRLTSASGSGTASDPVVLAEQFLELAPVTLVIRRKAALTDRDPLASLSLVKAVTNRSGQAWGGFVVELQEKLGHPSDYWDGLSFDQFGPRPADVSSDSFKKNNREFEPYDRIRFEDGHVDPGGTARFTMTITDPTPTPTFYLVQDPQLLSAGLSRPGRVWAGQTHAEASFRGGG